MSTHCQPPDHAASARIAANLPRFRPRPHGRPGGELRPANRPETGKANRGWLTTERAKALGKIGADKFAASKRGKSILPRCVGCLLAIGWGCKRIVRHTGWAKTSVHRWAKFNGLNLRATAEQKKQAAMGQRKRKAAEKKAARLAERARKKAERAANRQTDKERKAKALAYYYANHEASKKRGRESAIRRYWNMERGSPEHMKRRLRSRIYHAIVRGSKDTARSDRKAMPTMQLVGCSMVKLRRHIASQFTEGMTWANMGAWHIDHIVPCAAFDLSKPEHQQRCFNYKNLRPMWGGANISKGNLLFDSGDCLPLRAE